MTLSRLLCGMTALLMLAAPASHAGSLQILYAFKGGTDGTNPAASVIVHDGALFGTTNGGGNTGCGGFGCGTVFRLDAASGTETVLHRFTNSPDAATPFGPLLAAGRTLYGATLAGGTVYPGKGGVVAVNERNGSETVLGSLGSGALGYAAYGGLASAAGGLFGTTSIGGTGSGTIFQVDPSGGVHVVYEFAGGAGDGAAPEGNLIAHGGVLFGTTLAGGRSDYGTVFRFDPRTGQETVLHQFQGTDGIDPTSLVYDKGQLYGVTAGGGNRSCILGCGTIFRIDVATRAFSTLYFFNGGVADGYAGSSIVMLNGVLYGTTGAGGPYRFLCEYGCGTLFQYDLSARTEKVLNFFFKLKDGIFPNGVTVSDGVLYGTTGSGGDVKCEDGSGCGVVFAYTPEPDAGLRPPSSSAPPFR